MYKRVLPDWEQLSLQQKVAQLFVVRASGHLFDSQMRYPQWEASTATLQHWIQELGVGGVILLGGSVPELAMRTQQLQTWSQIPLLVAADIEEGVGRRFAGATWMPPPLALGDIARQNLTQACDYAERLGAITAREAQGIGINWILAPIVDVNNNPKNPVINVRAFAEAPEIVIPLIEAFIRGSLSYNVLTTAKHFPGHGDTAVDSHLELPLIPHDRQRLEQIELAPFQAAIAIGVNAIMTAHLQVPALDFQYPSSLSRLTLTTLLRQQMGFEGLIVTDALVMQAITKHYGAYEAPVMALEAGSDVILMPADPPGAIAAICEAVQTGRLSLDQLHQSLERIWRAKQKACTPTLSSGTGHEWENTATLDYCFEDIATPEAVELCEGILRQSLKAQPSVCPEPGPPSAIPRQTPELPQPNDNEGTSTVSTNLIIVDNLLEADFLAMHTPAVRLPQQWGYRLQWLDNQMLNQGIKEAKTGPTILQLFIRANPFQGTSGVIQMAQVWLEWLVSAQQLQGVVLYGSPYAWEQLSEHCPETVPAVFSYGQMPMAQTIALQKLLGLGLQTPKSQQDSRQLSQAFTD